MMKNSEIIDLAVMCLAVDQSPGDEVLAKRFRRALERATPVDVPLGMQMHLAVKLLSGKRYQIVTDNPETVRRARSIAADLGAAVEEFEQDGDKTKMVITPTVKS